MGDAIHDQVPALEQAPGLELVAGYVTGSPDIQWTPADFARFPGQVHVTIDQGFTGAPQYGSNVIDVEAGAWSPSAVPGWMAHATSPRPTVYCNRSNLTAVLATGWRGPIWLAFPGWDGQISSLPVLPFGCEYVAVQDVFASAYDLSQVLDLTWPEAKMIPDKPADVLQTLNMWSNPDGSLAWLYVGTDGYAYTRFDPGFKGWGPAVRVA